MTTRGYIEGCYGRLLDWSERVQVLDALAGLGLNAYAYAPKEDARHRLRWREPYDAAWRTAFAAFCDAAASRSIDVIAGLAPGIDFDFGSAVRAPGRDHPDGPDDLERAAAKLAGLREDGATRLMLLLDDIDDDFASRAGTHASEGEAHAWLANRLGERLDASLIVVPRVYAGELVPASPAYLADFARTLDPRHAVSVCGTDVVVREVSRADCRLPGDVAARETLLWDNLYANDYCPRRLFVGPWSGRHGVDDVLLNATGWPATDRLQLGLMAAGLADDAAGRDAAAREASARSVREAHGVPAAFEQVARAFRHPVTNDRLGEPPVALPASADVLGALDELLWRWKTPLSREWYPWLYGLRHDLLLAAGELAPDRVLKTQTPPFARAMRALGASG